MSGPATQFYVSGPAQIWLGVGTANAWSYLGWSRNGVTVQVTPQHEDIEVDYGGRSPGDVSFLGEEARISMQLSRYDESILMKAAAFLTGTTPGQGPKGGIGSLMAAEGYMFPILLYSPYSFKSQFGTMVPGFWFYQSYMADPLDQTLNVRAKQPNIAFRATPVFGSIVGGTFTAGVAPFDAFELYTNTMPSPMPTAD